MAFLRLTDAIKNETRDVPLRKPLVTLGREAGADIVLPDPTLAPVHANLLRRGNQFNLSVLERSAWFLVDGEKARSCDLRAGEQVILGRYVMTLMEGEPRVVEAPAAPPSGRPLDAVGSLERLVAFSGSVMAEPAPDKVFEALLSAVVAVTGAEKGFLIAFKTGERFLAAAHNVGKGASDLSRVSDSIVERVVETRQPLIVSDALRDSTFSTARSVVDLRLSSVMCVPLAYRNELLGVLYLGNDNVRNLFAEADLALLQVFASQAAMLVHTALLLDELKVTNRTLRDQLQAGQGGIIGGCAAMKDVFRVIRRVAPTDLGVLVLGETGTGKELVAKELHRLSTRGKGPFISINCGAIPENLLESELFGYRKGAFTGATTDKVGKFEAADGGTLFLDEIGEMPMNLQVKLLRVLQERVIERVGDVKGRPLDIRVVAATNRSPQEEVSAGRFREDLYYRLNEITLQLPPLRDRGDDLPLLAQALLTRFAAQYDSKAKGFTAGCLNAMRAYFWPGNIRELENRIKKAVIMTDRQQLLPEDLGLGQPTSSEVLQPLALAEEEFKKAYIRKALDQCQWNKAQAARILDVDPRTIFRYIEKFDD
jgi:transcriptional regulator with GAF, ATPase, and Fis domain